MINLYIIDDDHLIGAGFEKEFGFEGDGFQVIGCSRDIEGALKKIPGLIVSLIVLDLYIRGLDPIENVKLLRKSFPNLPIIVLTHEIDLSWKIRMFNEGISAYIIKSPNPEVLRRTFFQVMDGNRIIPEDIAKFISSSSPCKLSTTLDPKEKDILIKLIQGQNTTQIAESLFRTPSAIAKTIHVIKEKFKVKTTYELISLLTKLHLI